MTSKTFFATAAGPAVGPAKLLELLELEPPDDDAVPEAVLDEEEALDVVFVAAVPVVAVVAPPAASVVTSPVAVASAALPVIAPGPCLGLIAG